MDAAVLAMREYDIAWVLDDDKVYKLLLDCCLHGAVTLDVTGLRARVDLDEFEDEAIIRVAQRMLADAGLALKTLRGQISRRKDNPSWDEFKLGKSFPVGYENVWRHVYDEIDNAVRAEIEAEEAAAKPPDVAKFFGTIGGFQVPEFPHFGVPRVRPTSERPRLQGRVDATSAETSSLKAEIGIAGEHLGRTVSPGGLVTGVAMLVYMAVTTLVVPLLLLTPTPATLNQAASRWFLAVFLSGVLALLGYLTWDAVRLVRRPSGLAVSENPGARGSR